MRRKTVLRAGAGVAAAALLAPVAWGLVVVLLIAAIGVQRPDPSIPDGDPCCTHPDTRGEVVAGIGWTLVWVVAEALLVCLVVSLLVWAVRGRWPSLRRLALIPAGGLTVAVVILGVVLVRILA